MTDSGWQQGRHGWGRRIDLAHLIAYADGQWWVHYNAAREHDYGITADIDAAKRAAEASGRSPRAPMPRPRSTPRATSPPAASGWPDRRRWPGTGNAS